MPVGGATLNVHSTSTSLRLRRVRFEITGGPDVGAQKTFDLERVSVGTASGNDLQLSDVAVSRHHFEVVLQAEGCLLRDLGSTNGTWVEGMRAESVFLKSGFRIFAGRTELRFETMPEETDVELAAQHRFGDLLGQSAAMRKVFAVLAKVAVRDITVLCTGESGTGKELVARALHDQSPRRQGPFTVMDCGAMPMGLMENEIFGHEKGAFTGAARARAGAFERADGGTLFLDEIGELPLELQPKLLRVLETREVARLGGGKTQKLDVRVVAATNRDLRAEVNRGTFRSDLYYRLSVVEIRLPALRERPDDIPLLVEHFLDAVAKRASELRHQLPTEMVEHLKQHLWLGNVRELRNFVERTVSLSDGETWLPMEDGLRDLCTGQPAAAASPAPVDRGAIEAQPVSVPAPAPEALPTAAASIVALGSLSFREAKRLYNEPFEREYLRALLERTSGNVSKAARDADMDRAHLNQLLKKYDLK